MTTPPPATGRPGRDPVGQRDPLWVRLIGGLYPAPWRERYGEEFAALLIDLSAGASWPTRVRAMADGVGGAFDARRHPVDTGSLPSVYAALSRARLAR